MLAIVVAMVVGTAGSPLPALRRPRAPVAYTPLFCGGSRGEADDDIAWDAGHQKLWINQTRSECASTMLPLLASYLGDSIVAGEMACYVGPAALPASDHPVPLPRSKLVFLQLAATLPAKAGRRRHLAAPVPR